MSEKFLKVVRTSCEKLLEKLQKVVRKLGEQLSEKVVEQLSEKVFKKPSVKSFLEKLSYKFCPLSSVCCREPVREPVSQKFQTFPTSVEVSSGGLNILPPPSLQISSGSLQISSGSVNSPSVNLAQPLQDPGSESIFLVWKGEDFIADLYRVTLILQKPLKIRRKKKFKFVSPSTNYNIKKF